MTWSHLSAAHFVEAAENLAPFIYAERSATERNRALSSDLFGAIRDAGLFSLWVPRDFGGPEIPIRDFMLVVEALARADASIGWCAANASTNSVLFGYLPGLVVREIWDNGQTVMAGALNSNAKSRVHKRCNQRSRTKPSSSTMRMRLPPSDISAFRKCSRILFYA